MKILATADWHLGAYVGPQCDDPMMRMENTIKCLDVLVETAEREQPDIILISGDIFHAARVWSDRALVEVRAAARYINFLGHIAPTVVLYGTPNHDGKAQFDALPDLVDDSTVTFFAEPAIRIIHTKSGPIQIAGLPGFDKGHFRAQFPGLSAEEENQVFTQQLTQIVQGLSAQLDPTIPSVLMAHHTVVGCELDNGQHVFQANEVVLDAATLDNSNFDLVCLGHIHKAQRVEACNKPVYYAGSIDAFTFNDEGHEKGFWLHHLNNTKENYASNFIGTSARRFLTLKLDQNMTSALISDKIVPPGLRDLVVRILYACDSETEKALDKKKLERDLYAAGAYYVSEIRPESITASVNREGMTEKMTVDKCLAKYLEEKGHTFEDIPQIMYAAMPIINEAQASSPIGSQSGLFLPVEIEVRNYRSYAEEKLSFEDIFFAMVNGVNGSGKSSLFMDAITDCLYEETREKELTGWIRNGEKSGSIVFTFKLDPDMWRVTRTRQRSGKATLALAKSVLYFADFGEEKPGESGYEWHDHSCERLVDTQQKIIDLLGMDCDTFQSCVLIMQDRYGKFMEASKDDRMAVLANLLGLGIYDELAKITKDKLTDANRDVKTHKTEIEGLETEVAAEDSLHTELLQIQAQLSVAADDLQENKDELAKLQAKLGAAEGYAREAAELEKELKQKTGAYEEKKNRKADLENRVYETNSFLEGEQTILDKCAELDKARLDIAALDGKVQLLNDKKARRFKVNQDLSAVQQYRTNTAKTIATINENLKDRERLEKLVEGNTVEVDLEECERKAGEYRELDSMLSRMESGGKLFHRETQATCDNKNAKLAGLKKQVEMLGNSNCIDTVKAQCKFLHSAKLAALEANNLEIEIETYIAERTKIAELTGKEFAELEEKIKATGYDSDLHNILLQEVKTFRAAKDRLAKMAGDAATANALKQQDSENIIKIEGYGKELEALSAEIAELEKETGKVAELNSRVRELLAYEEEKMQLSKAKQFVESTGEAIRQLEADLAELSQAISKINARLAELAGLTADINVHRICKGSMEQKIKGLELAISNFNQTIGMITAQIGVIEGKKTGLEAEREALRESAKQAAMLQVLAEAFSQDGIPYQIIRDIVPELEAAANEILSQMTGGRMRLEFVTEKVLKSNKAKEIATLEIIISDIDHGVLPYLSRSGGQKVRAALANSFALAMIKASRVGLQLGMLFIDEPSFLDAEGIEGYCAALETIHNRYPDMRILAISHDENMKSRFPQQLYVEMTENGSKVRRL